MTKGHPDQATHLSAEERSQRPLVAIKADDEITFACRREQLAAKVVSPTVVRTHQPPAGSRLVRRLLQRHASMGTAVNPGVQTALMAREQQGHFQQHKGLDLPLADGAAGR